MIFKVLDRVAGVCLAGSLLHRYIVWGLKGKFQTHVAMCVYAIPLTWLLAVAIYVPLKEVWGLDLGIDPNRFNLLHVLGIIGGIILAYHEACCVWDDYVGPAADYFESMRAALIGPLGVIGLSCLLYWTLGSAGLGTYLGIAGFFWLFYPPAITGFDAELRANVEMDAEVRAEEDAEIEALWAARHDPNISEADRRKNNQQLYYTYLMRSTDDPLNPNIRYLKQETKSPRVYTPPTPDYRKYFRDLD